MSRDNGRPGSVIDGAMDQVRSKSLFLSDPGVFCLGRGSGDDRRGRN